VLSATEQAAMLEAQAKAKQEEQQKAQANNTFSPEAASLSISQEAYAMYMQASDNNE
jgi:hypothetical protein